MRLLTRVADALSCFYRLWILKTTILEFFKRLTGGSWERSSHITLQVIRGTLVATFIAIVISDFAECQPFDHYWQVSPDPGGQCRQGYAQLITMAACNILTDLLLVFFPIPIIVGSHMRTKRKVQLILLFSLSLAVVGVTLYRVPMIINHHGRQQLRSLLASVELLFATTAANALVLGSFVRDRGVKKRKYKIGSMADSIDRSSDSRSRRPTMNRHWGSDEDLVRDLGLGVNPELREMPESPSHSHDATYHPAPVAKLPGNMSNWQFGGRRRSAAEKSEDSTSNPDMMTSHSMATPRKVSFFDVGGLLTDDLDNALRRPSHVSTGEGVSPQAVPATTVPAGTSGLRRGSTALLQDLGGFFGPLSSVSRSRSVSKPPQKDDTEPKPVPGEPVPEPPQRSRANSTAADMVLLDPGGLLTEKTK